MGHYVVNTKDQQEAMLQECGYASFAEMFTAAGIKDCFTGPLSIPDGVSEFEAYAALKAMADANKIFKTIFRGAGAYRHYIPSVVKHITSREEFVSAYTPYQAELSQGVLQAIYEYQTMICELTQMDVSNASVYDGATAAAEAVNMCTGPKEKKVIISTAVNPQTRNTIATYHRFADLQIVDLPDQNGVVDLQALEQLIDAETACVIVQYPNYFGCIEDLAAIRAKSAAVKLVVIAEPISLGWLEAPGRLGADIVVGEGQPLGMPLSFGGPYLGFMATTNKLVRRLPGRIVGATAAADGKTAYTLTLQAREQHIRREKAGSNICTNQALCAFTAAVYLSALGPQGLSEVADGCYRTAHYLQEELAAVGFKLVYTQPFFNEFVTTCPLDSGQLSSHLQEHDILGGYPLPDGHILWCATEVNTKAEIDQLITVIKEVL